MRFVVFHCPDPQPGVAEAYVRAGEIEDAVDASAAFGQLMADPERGGRGKYHLLPSEGGACFTVELTVTEEAAAPAPAEPIEEAIDAPLAE